MPPRMDWGLHSHFPLLVATTLLFLSCSHALLVPGSVVGAATSRHGLLRGWAPAQKLTCRRFRASCAMVAAPPPPATAPAPAVWVGRLLAAIRALIGKLLVWLRILPPTRVLPVAPWCPLAEVITGRATRDFLPPHEVYLYYSYMTSPFYAVAPSPPRGTAPVDAGFPVRWMRSLNDVVHPVDRGRDRARFE